VERNIQVFWQHRFYGFFKTCVTGIHFSQTNVVHLFMTPVLKFYRQNWECNLRDSWAELSNLKACEMGEKVQLVTCWAHLVYTMLERLRRYRAFPTPSVMQEVLRTCLVFQFLAIYRPRQLSRVGDFRCVTGRPGNKSTFENRYTYYLKKRRKFGGGWTTRHVSCFKRKRPRNNAQSKPLCCFL